MIGSSHPLVEPFPRFLDEIPVASDPLNEIPHWFQKTEPEISQFIFHSGGYLGEHLAREQTILLQFWRGTAHAFFLLLDLFRTSDFQALDW